MPMPSPERFPFATYLWGAAVLLLIAGSTSAQGQRGPRTSDEFPIVSPARRPVEVAPVSLPSLPSEAGSVAALTLNLQVKMNGDGASTFQHQTFSRTTDRVHLKVRDGAEWLFVQNPVDGRRVYAYLIDHEHKVLVRHDESELRTGQQIRGWLDVLTLGFDPGGLVELKATDRIEAVGGVPFTQHLRPTPGTGIQEVWWSDTQLLALRIVSSTGLQTRTVSVDHIREGVDVALLSPPEQRFPSYRTVDLPDWLEER